MAKTKDRITRFETALGDLETIVEKLEGGELSLEESLQQFEHGIKLARECQTTLKEAELKVSRLMEDGTESPEVEKQEKEQS